MSALHGQTAEKGRGNKPNLPTPRLDYLRHRESPNKKKCEKAGRERAAKRTDRPTFISGPRWSSQLFSRG